MTPLLAANWKMNLDRAKIKNFCEKLSANIRSVSPENLPGLMIFPPSPYLGFLAEELHHCGLSSKVKVGAQNAYGELAGAFTGEISAAHIKDVGGSCVLLAHSERRKVFSEDEPLLQKRLSGLVAQGLEIIYCVGETKAERESGRTEDVLRAQLQTVKPHLKNADLILAYEPVWAIGTGVVATAEQIEQTHSFIKNTLGPSSPAVIYGGSVTPENFGEILEIPSVDGGLVGGASLDPTKFLALIETCAKKL